MNRTATPSLPPLKSREATPARTSAPAAPPSVPSQVTPPEVPAGSARPVSSERGILLDSPPISVAILSAVAAASAPHAAHHHMSDSGWYSQMNAHAVNTPPLATTCSASRAPDFSTTPSVSCAFRLAPILDAAVPRTKKNSSTTAHRQPAVSATLPTIAAAAAPLAVRAPSTYAAVARTNAKSGSTRYQGWFWFNQSDCATAPLPSGGCPASISFAHNARHHRCTSSPEPAPGRQGQRCSRWLVRAGLGSGNPQQAAWPERHRVRPD